VKELKERLRECSQGLPGILEKKEIINAICASHGDSTSQSCAICSEDYATGDPLRVLGCNHRFHIECVDKWLLACDFSRPPACPFCNSEIMKPNS